MTGSKRSRILLTIAILTTAWLAVAHAEDFRVYWTAGRDLRVAGWDTVYQISTLTPFKYHPTFALLLLPLGLLPFLAAKLVWAALNGLAILDTMHRWRRDWEVDPVAIGIGFLGVAHGLTWELHFGNVTFLMLWLWTVAATSPDPWRRAVGSAVLIALKPFWLILLVPWLLARQWATVGRVAIVLMALFAVPLLLGPESMATGYSRWVATFADPLHAHNVPKNDNQTWYAVLFRHESALGGRLLIYWLAGSALVGLLWLVRWSDLLRRVPPWVATWWLELTIVPVMLWAAPLSWIHHQILLWPLLALGWLRTRASRPDRLVWIATWLLLNGTGEFLLGRRGFEAAYQWGIPILAFPLLAWWGRRWVERGPSAEAAPPASARR